MSVPLFCIALIALAINAFVYHELRIVRKVQRRL